MVVCEKQPSASGGYKMEHTVFIKNCENYDRKQIKQIIANGMKTLDYRPQGKVMVKPNVVFSYNPDVFGDMAWTATPLMGAAVEILSAQSGVRRVDVGENCAVGFPTRLCYRNAGYYEEMSRVNKRAKCPVGIFCMDEEPRRSVFVGGKVHDNLRISRKMADADSIVSLPKLKCHCVTRMTGAVKLNIGICSDDERSIRHDFMLNEKIVDLLAPGYPDFIVMDAVDVGVGNEAFPSRRKLGLLIMGTNPIAVDIVGARLLGLAPEQVPYLKVAFERGYTPVDAGQINLTGDVTSLPQLDEKAKRLLPYDDAFFHWQDIETELARMKSPMRFFWGPYGQDHNQKCLTGCVMGLKMFLSSLERFAGSEAFSKARPIVFVIGRYDETIDAAGDEVFLLGSCASAEIINAKKITRIDKCFTTAGDMNLAIGHKLGLPAPTRDPAFLCSLFSAMAASSVRKTFGGRYFQDIAHFFTKGLIRKI